MTPANSISKPSIVSASVAGSSPLTRESTSLKAPTPISISTARSRIRTAVASPLTEGSLTTNITSMPLVVRLLRCSMPASLSTTTDS